jgi:hypothetical protein
LFRDEFVIYDVLRPLDVLYTKIFISLSRLFVHLYDSDLLSSTVLFGVYRVILNRGSRLESLCVSYKATEWGGPSDENGTTEALCHSRCCTIKIPLCSKALSAEHKPKFLDLHR